MKSKEPVELGLSLRLAVLFLVYLQVPPCHIFLVPILLFRIPTHLPPSLLGPVFGRVGRVGIGRFPLGCLSLELAVIRQRGLCGRGSFELYLLNGVKGGSQEG